MAKQWGTNAKRRLYLVAALGIILVLSGGTFAYTYTTSVRTISVGEPSADIISYNTSANQPNWSSITDNLSENTTCGEVPTGDLFDITPSSAYSGGAMATVYLTNTGDLVKAYNYLNMKLYIYGSEEAEETPNYRLLTLQNGKATFTRAVITPSSGNWTQTSQADFEGGTLNQVDTTTSPGDVILDEYTDNVTDSFDDQSKIASSYNVTISGGQVKLTFTPGASDNETLRPNAVGDRTDINDQYPVSGAHWDKVDETTSDGDSTYVETNNYIWQYDLYGLPDHVSGTGIINYVRVYMVARHLRGTDTPENAGARVHIKTNGVEYSGTEQNLTGSYATYSYTWNTNPQTGSAWTWTQIDNLQAGIGLQRSFNGGNVATRHSRCTQVYVEVNYTPQYYNSPGRITSTNLLSGKKVVSIDNFYYDASAIPSGTSLKTQYSTDNSTWYDSSGTLNGWDTLSQGSANISLAALGWSGPNFYYRAEFTSDGTDTPVLDEIRVYFSSYYASGDLTSSAYDTEYDVEWGTISFTIVEPSATDIKFQLRSASTEGGLSSATWYGPTGTDDYYTTSGTAINSVHDGDRWIQYKAYFSGPSDDTPTLSDVNISYTGTPITFVMEVIGGSYCLVSDNTSEWAPGWTTTPEFFCEIIQR